MGIGRLVRPRADAVRDGVGRLAGIAGLGDALPDDPVELREGMVLAIEPGCYIEGGGGLRVEDNFLITSDGSEKLSPFPDGIVQA